MTADEKAPETSASSSDSGAPYREFSARRQAFNRVVSGAADGALTFMHWHWLAVLNSVLALFIGVALLAPLGSALGYTGPSSAVFDFYRFFCGQVPSHSFYVAGYQVCLCSRCLAIYSSLLAAGLTLAMFRYTRFRGVIQPINWQMWALGMLPMALDGGTQLFGWHESNVFLRLLTGAIFGIMTAWFVLPQIEQSSPVEAIAAPSVSSHGRAAF